MTDLVERLKEESLKLARNSFDSADAGISANLCDEAIDEIERLRQANMKFDLTEDDIGTLLAAVENMRAATSSDEERSRLTESRWRIAEKIENLNRRIDAARRGAQPI